MQELRANTEIIVTVGPFVDKDDGLTPQIDITLSGNEAELLKHGSVTVVDISGATWAAIANCRGYYGLTLTTSHTNTEGLLTVIVQDDSDCLPVKQEFLVLSQAAWDSKYAAKDDGYMDVNVKTATLTALDAILKTSTFALAMADAIWDEILTGSTHNIATSAGRRLRQVEAAAVHASGTIAAVTDGHTITLDAGAVATADYYVGDRLQIIEGVGIGQSRLITTYTAGKVCTLDSNFTTNPNTSSLYDVVAADVHVSLSDADLAGGFVATYTNTTTITLDAGAVATADYYQDMMIIFTHGTGAGQSTKITNYTAGRVCTLSPALTVAIDTTTSWHIAATVTSGLSLASDGLDLVTSWTTNITGSVSGNSTHDAAAVKTAIEAGGSSLAQILTDTGTTLPATLASILSDSNAILVDTGTTLPASITALQNDSPGYPTKGVALTNFVFFMVDSADHVSAKTGLTVTATVGKDGGAFAGSTNSSSEISDGFYKLTITSTEMNADVVSLKLMADGADVRAITILTQPT